MATQTSKLIIAGVGLGICGLALVWLMQPSDPKTTGPTDAGAGRPTVAMQARRATRNLDASNASTLEARQPAAARRRGRLPAISVHGPTLTFEEGEPAHDPTPISVRTPTSGEGARETTELHASPSKAIAAALAEYETALEAAADAIDPDQAREHRDDAAGALSGVRAQLYAQDGGAERYAELQARLESGGG